MASDSPSNPGAKVSGISPPGRKYQEIAATLGMSEGAVKQAALELRREFGGVLRDEIRRTVADETQVDEEIRYLIGLLRTY